MYTMAIIVGAVVLVAITTIRRIFLHGTIPWLFWPVLLLSTAAPIYVTYTVLYPGEVATSATIKGEKDRVSLEIPEGYHLMVTATLADLEEEDDELEANPEKYVTHYVLKVSGAGWRQSCTGEIRRKSEEPGGPDISIDGENSIRGTGGPRLGSWGQDIQDRFALKGSGKTTISVYNWQGEAAESLTLETVKGPPPLPILVGIILVLGGLSVVCDVKYGMDRLAADIGFLTFAAAAVTYRVTPLGDFRDVIFAMAISFLGGGLLMGGVATLGLKFWGPKPLPEEEIPAPKGKKIKRSSQHR